MKKFLLGLLFLMVVVGLTSTSSAIPLVNGDFDDTTTTPDIAGNINEYTLNTIPDGKWDVFDSIHGWQAGAGDSGIEIQHNTMVDAYSPNYYVELDSHGGTDTNSSMYQTVYLEAGSYELSFWYHARTNNDNDDNGIRAAIGSQFIGFVSETYDDQPDIWEQITWNFTIDNSDNYDLTFAAYGEDNSLGGFIDSVSLNSAPVPEPATMMLFGIGLLGLAGVSRRKK